MQGENPWKPVPVAVMRLPSENEHQYTVTAELRACHAQIWLLKPKFKKKKKQQTFPKDILKFVLV